MSESTPAFPYVLNYEWEHPWPRSPLPVNEKERMEALQRYNILNTEKEEKYDKLCEYTQKVTKCQIVAITFISGEHQWFKARIGLSQDGIPRDVAFCAHTIMTPKLAMTVPNMKRDVRFQKNPLVTRASMLLFYAAVPLLSTDGHAIGTIFVSDTKIHENFDMKKLIQISQTVNALLETRLDNSIPLAVRDIPEGRVAPPRVASNPPPPRTSAVNNPSRNSTAPPRYTTPSRTSDSAPARISREPSQTAGTPPITPPPRTAETTPPMYRQPAPKTVPAPKSNKTLSISKKRRGTQQQRAHPQEQVSQALIPALRHPPQTSTELAPPLALGDMLISLLAKTTETQEQIAHQQAIMFGTISQHTDQLTSLSDKFESLEARLDDL